MEDLNIYLVEALLKAPTQTFHYSTNQRTVPIFPVQNLWYRVLQRDVKLMLLQNLWNLVG